MHICHTDVRDDDDAVVFVLDSHVIDALLVHSISDMTSIIYKVPD